MVKPLETLAGADATRFQTAIRPHLVAVLGEEGYASPTEILDAIDLAVAAKDGAQAQASAASSAAADAAAALDDVTAAVSTAVDNVTSVASTAVSDVTSVAATALSDVTTAASAADAAKTAAETAAASAGNAASARSGNIDLAINIPTRSFHASVTTIITGGYSTAGIGGGIYVSDTLANGTTGANYPALCKQSGDGRWWRLLPSTAGAIHVDQVGGKANAPTSAANVTNGLIKLRNYLADVIGGGILQLGAGTYYLSRAALNAAAPVENGFYIGNKIVLAGVGKTQTTLVIDDAAPALPGTAYNVILSLAGASPTIRDLEVKGFVSINNAAAPVIENVAWTGLLSSETQYADETLNIPTAFLTRTYSDGTMTSGNTDIVTVSSAPSDTTYTYSGTTLTIGMAASGVVGSARYMRYTFSDYIPLDPAKFYVAAFDPGFLTGDGATRPMIVLYDADHNPLPSHDVRAYPTNLYEPSQAFQFGTSSAFIGGASYMRIGLGAARDTSTPAGLSAVFDLSKIRFYSLTNDFAAWAAWLSGRSSGWVSPGDLGQLGIYNSTDARVTNCDFRMIGRCGITMVGCENALVERNTFRFVMQGYTDSGGKRNTFRGNLVDLRMRTTGNVLIGSRAFRLRCVGGQTSDKAWVIGNRLIGASWGLEMLPNSLAKSAIVENNHVEAEFAGVSVARADWVCRNNVVRLASDGAIGVEAPAGDDGTGLGYGGAKALVEGNDIRWAEFSGYRGVGVSCTDIASATVKGGFIKAPTLIQALGSSTNGTLHVDGTDGEYAISAVLGLAGPIYARWGRLVPTSVSMVDQNTGWLPGNAMPSSGVFDISTNGPTRNVSIGADHVEVGLCPLANVQFSATATLRFPDIYTANAATPDYYVRYKAITAQNSIVSLTLGFRGLPSGASSAKCCNIINGANLGASSIISMVGCSVGGERLRIPDGSYARSYLRGDIKCEAYPGSQTIGTSTGGTSWSLAAGATWTSGNLSLLGLSELDQIVVIPRAGMGSALDKAIVKGRYVSDDTFVIAITNPTGAALTGTTLGNFICYAVMRR